MRKEMEFKGDTVGKIHEDNKKKKWIWAIVCIVIALLSYFVISKWATSLNTYSGVYRTLNNLQKKALEMTGTATALATGAASVPGDATTPIANKLADVAGYMVIVYVAIIIEKYLLTLMGFITFKLFVPIGVILAAVGKFLRTEWKAFVYRIAAKLIISGILLWCLVPTSAWVTNWINDTYQSSHSIDSDLITESKNINSQDKEPDVDTEEKEDDGFSIKNTLSDLVDKVSDVGQEAAKLASDKVDDFQEALNQLIESVAVMIVTTCVIPILVLLMFIWILKIVTGLNLPAPTVQSVPRGSKLVRKNKKVE